MKIKNIVLAVGLFGIQSTAQARLVSLLGPHSKEVLNQMVSLAHQHPFIDTFSWEEQYGPCDTGAQVDGDNLVKYVRELAEDLYKYAKPGTESYEEGLSELESRVDDLEFSYHKNLVTQFGKRTTLARFCNGERTLVLQLRRAQSR